MTQIWAHRGASADAPENTMDAFQLAIEQGADGIELDVQLTADGVLVVCHDETIDRTSDGTGAIAELTLDQLRQYNFNNGHDGMHCPIPTLAEVLDLIAPTHVRLNIELKNSIVRYRGMEATCEALIETSHLAGSASERLIYSSFNHRSLELLVASGTRVPVGALFVEPLVKSWDYAHTFGAVAIHPHWGSLDEGEVAECHENGVFVHTWTVDDPTQVLRLAQQGVDAIITNTPLRARQVLGRV